VIHQSTRLKTIIACIVALSGCGARPDEAELFRQAVQAFRDGKPEKALELANSVIKQCKPDTECSWDARLLEAEVQLDGDSDSAATLLSQQPPMRFTALEARRLWLQGDLEAGQEHFELAEELYSKARQMASSAGAWDVIAEVDFSRAKLLFVAHHDMKGAEALLRSVARDATRHQDAYYDAIALNGLGMLRQKLWRFDEARPLFQQAVDAARNGGGQRLVAAASHNLGICYAHLGSFDAAIKSHQTAMDLLGESGSAYYRMELRRQTGNAYFDQGDYHKAIEFYLQAVTLARRDKLGARCYRALASAYAKVEDWDAAERNNNTAISYWDDAELRPWTEENQAIIASGRGMNDKACALYRKTIADAKQIPVLLWESHAALANIYARTGKYREADDEFTKTVEIIDKDTEKISTLDYRMSFFSLQIDFYHDYTSALLARHADRRALEIADSSRARLLRQRLSITRNAEPAPSPDYSSVARRLNSVLLFYEVMPRQSYLWVINQAGVHPPIPLPAAEQIRHWVEQYRAFIEQKVGDPMTATNEAGQQLYNSLIAPAARLIPRNSRVILIPDDALYWLNFETLPVYPNSSQELPHYWIEDVRLEIAPSLMTLAKDQSTRPHAPASVLIIGNPLSPNRDFPKLDYAATEIETIEAKLPAAQRRSFTGPAAVPAAYQTAGPGKFSLLHFSAHAEANRESPLDSAIILSPEGDNFKLYARNVIDIPLTADLVTISACRSAGARSYSGEGLVGFAWAFLQAGAHNVIAGLWDVTDSSTPEIMGVLYSNLASGVSPADALRAAKLNLIHSGRGYHRPYYWGPFQIYTR